MVLRSPWEHRPGLKSIDLELPRLATGASKSASNNKSQAAGVVQEKAIAEAMMSASLDSLSS
jgi:hypothetical protein